RVLSHAARASTRSANVFESFTWAPLRADPRTIGSGPHTEEGHHPATLFRSRTVRRPLLSFSQRSARGSHFPRRAGARRVGLPFLRKLAAAGRGRHLVKSP